MASVGAIFYAFTGFVIYIMSKASNVLVNIGHRLDNVFRKDELIPDTTDNAQQLKILPIKTKMNKFIPLTAVAGIYILINNLIWSVRHYQETILLSDKYLNFGSDTSDQQFYNELIKWLVIFPNIITKIYCESAFQGSFARELIMKIIDKSDKSIYERNNGSHDYLENTELTIQPNSKNNQELIMTEENQILFIFNKKPRKTNKTSMEDKMHDYREEEVINNMEQMDIKYSGLHPNY